MDFDREIETLSTVVPIGGYFGVEVAVSDGP